MKPNDYLKKVLAKQTFDDDAPELKDLRRRREAIRSKLLSHFSDSSPSIRWAGSMAKTTMIRASYDGDLTNYFRHDDTAAGETLEEIYDNTADALSDEYDVERKASALRVKDRSTKPTKGYAEDTHVDVVPGRFIDDDESDVNLRHDEKRSLKTNLQTHIDHIKGSRVVEAIRLMKLWNVDNGIGAKTFVLELLVVKLLENRKSDGLASQLEHVWSEMRDDPDGLAVEDPANPSGNDLKPDLDKVRYQLSAVARRTLENIDAHGWESVFGPVDDDDGEDEKAKARRAAAVAAVSTPTRPWCGTP